MRDYLDWVVSAYPDYALIAHKQADEASAPWFDYLDKLTEAQQGTLETLAAKMEEQTEQLARCQQQLVKYDQEKQLLEQHNAHLEHHLNSVLQSRSWRITLPLRQVMGWKRGSAQALGKLLRRLAQIPWLKRLALKVLNRFPALKVRVLKRMAASEGLFSRAGQLREEDFKNLDADVTAAVRQEALTLRDATLADQALFPKGIRLEGHINGSYSLAAVNRHLLNRLHASEHSPVLWLVLTRQA